MTSHGLAELYAPKGKLTVPPEVPELRYMEAQKGGPCRYCDDEIRIGYQIAGHYGILWGHDTCVEEANADSRLILSPNNRDRRPLELKFRCDRVWAGNKVKPWSWTELTSSKHLEELKQRIFEGLMVPKELLGLGDSSNQTTMPSSERVFGSKTGRLSCKQPNFSNEPRTLGPSRIAGLSKGPNHQNMPKSEKLTAIGRLRELTDRLRGKAERPEQTCGHFKPIHIMEVTMSDDMRPYGNVLDGPGLNMETFKEILERIWKELIDSKFSHYKRGEHRLPTCPVHTHLQLQVCKLENPWHRNLWWNCRGDIEERPKRTYRGYELL